MSPEARRHVRFYVRASLAEAEFLRVQAGARHLPVAKFLLLAATRRRLPPLPVPSVDVATVGQLAAIGNNLNQAVHLLHIGRLDRSFETALADLSREVSALRRRLLHLPEEPEES